MQKKLFCLVLTSVFLLSGCESSKTLSCREVYHSSNGNEAIQETTITFDQKGKKAKSVKVNLQATYGSTYSSLDLDSLYQESKRECEDYYSEKDKVTCEVTKAGRTISQTLDYDITSAKEDVLTKLELEGLAEADYETFKERLENQGFTCE